MVRQSITSKTQIPQYIQKRITNFKNLTPNKAIFEYEKFLLLRRAKGDYKQFLEGYIETPERVTKKIFKNCVKCVVKNLNKNAMNMNEN